MKTYWFTVAVGDKFARQAGDLVQSGRRHDITVDVLDGNVERVLHPHPKSLKIQGILNAPAWADRIVFLDSDTLILDPTGHDETVGSVLETWTRPDTRMVGNRANAARYARMIQKHYPEFDTHHARNRSWNSGVIMGNRDAMMALAENWRVAWKRVCACTGGTLHRDQASYRIAYHQTGLPELGRSWNWILKRWGVRDDVNIIHAGGEPIGPGKRKQWEALKGRVLL
jgi:hypothetical protein